MSEDFYMTYVGLPNAKLLKEIGFNVYCESCYSTAIMHNGEPLGSDEEFELRCEGRENEIEYIDGGSIINLYSVNGDYEGCYTRPSQEVVIKWLRKHYHIHIVAMPYITEEGQFWVSDAYTFETERYDKIKGMTTMLCTTPEESNEKTLEKVLKYISVEHIKKFE